MTDDPEPTLLGDGALVADDAGLGLVAGRCLACGEVEFPARRYCRRCGARVDGMVDLPRAGRLLTAAVDRLGAVFARPYAVAQVMLAEGVVVQGYLQGDPDSLPPVGTTVHLVPHRVPASSYGGPYVTFAFTAREPR